MFAAAGGGSGARSSKDGNTNLEYNVQNLASIVANFGSEHGALKMTVDGLRLAVNGLIAEIGPGGCHCRHVDTIADEVKATIEQLNALNMPLQSRRIDAIEQTVQTLMYQFQASAASAAAVEGS